MKRTLFSTCAAALACAAFTSAAQSSPISAVWTAAKAGVTNSESLNVHYRESRHCHWRDGERHCHGGDGDSYYDSDGPGIVLNLGRRHRHSRDWDRGDHDNNSLSFRQRHRRVF